MHDVWVLGAFDARDSKPARGAWLCPSLGVYSVTKKSKAVDMNDGLRIGCAMAILSALNSLGENLTIHLPKYPAPRWVINPNRAVPLPTRRCQDQSVVIVGNPRVYKALKQEMAQLRQAMEKLQVIEAEEHNDLMERFRLIETVYEGMREYD